MSSMVSILDNGPACEPDKFIVEIVGKAHPDTQKLLICDEAGEPMDAVTAAASDEILDAGEFASLLKVWNWNEMTGKSLSLQIACDSGNPIRLPLLAGALRPTPRQEEAQLNQIVPVIPCTSLPDLQESSDLGVPVLMRSGYLYVFYNFKLWREIEIRFTDIGTRFHDIDVARYREGKGFKQGKRIATGVALEDIWLPSQWNGRAPIPVQLMYSEVQLSAARLAYMETHESRLEYRTRSPQLLITESSLEERWADSDTLSMLEERNSNSITRHKMDRFAFPLKLCAPQRPRQPGHEWLLDQPAGYICDLSGEYMGQALTSTRETVSTWREGIAAEPARKFESEAWHACQSDCDADTSAFWATQGPHSDVLESARQRMLHAVLLPDPMYRMRHLASRIDNLQELLKDCTRLAMEHPHHASALLLHNLAVPPRIGGGLNPMSRSLQEKLKDKGKREINIATAAIERAHVRKLLEAAQQSLAEALELNSYQRCIEDHLSLEGVDYPAAMFFVARLLACIATPAAQLDPLAFNGDIHDAVNGLHLHRNGRSSAQRLLTRIANDDRHPLHVMLWPQIKDDQLFSAYQAPAAEEPNQGDGRFRATALASLEHRDAGDSDSQTLDAITLEALMESGALQDAFTLQMAAKQGMMVLSRINEVLHGAVQAAERHVNELADQAREDQERHRNALAAQTRKVNIRLHGMQAEHLRQTMPKAFEGARFIRAGNIGQSTMRDYYLFGLEDLPEVDPNAAAARIFGEYRDSSGRLLATTNARSARRSGMPIIPESGTYFVIPADSHTARVLRKLNRAINDEALADSALVAARTTSHSASTPLQRAIDNLRRAREGSVYRALNSRPFSAMVLMMEVWNVQVAREESDGLALERGETRRLVGKLNLWGDLIIAFEALAAKLSASQPLTVFAQRAALKISDEFAIKLLGTKLAKHVVRIVTVRILAVTAASLLLAGLSLSDAIHAAKWGDQAVWGYSMMAAGGLLGASATLVSGSAIFGLVGFAAVALIAGGAAAVALFSNTDFDDWLAGSIFGEEGAFSSALRSAANIMPFIDATPRYLEEPHQAFYRLVGLMTGIRIQIDDNPAYDPRAGIGTDSTPGSFIKRANTRISVTTNILGLASQLGTPEKIVRCCLARREISIIPTPQGTSHQSVIRLIPELSKPLLTHITQDAVILYVNTPLGTYENIHGYRITNEYYWEVRAQVRLEDNQGTVWLFPSPGPKTAPVDVEQYTEPDFRKTKQPFWADQGGVEV